MALSSLTGKFNTTFQATPQNTSANPLVGAISTQATILKNSSVSTSLGNAVAGGADEAFSFRTAIAAGASATVDMSAMTNLLAQASVTLARLKGGWQVRLLSAADDSTISPSPNASSIVTVSNVGLDSPGDLNFGSGGSGLTVALTVAAGAVTAVAIGAAGTAYPKSTVLLASPVQAGGSGCAFGVITDASGVPSSVVFIAGAGGASYSAATVPTIIVGQFKLTTGNAMCGVDVTAAGITVASTKKNFKYYNNDASNAVTLEFSAFGGST